MHTLPTAHAQVKPPGGAWTVIGDPEADREAWLAARRTVITAGEVPYVLGMYGPSARVRLWYDKAGWTERESADDFEGAQMGHRLEAVNAEIFSEKTGRRVRRVQKLLQSTRYSWLGATLDYEQWPTRRDSPVPLELKSTGAGHNWPETENDVRYPDIEFVGEPSLRWQAQLQAQLLVTGAAWGSLSGLIGSPYFHHRHRDFPIHSRFCDMILQKTRAFHESLQSGIPPKPDDSEGTLTTLKEAARRRLLEGSTRALPIEASAWADELERARRDQAEAARRTRLFESSLLTVIGDAERGVLTDGRVYLIKRTPRRAYSVAASTVVSLKREDKETPS